MERKINDRQVKYLIGYSPTGKTMTFDTAKEANVFARGLLQSGKVERQELDFFTLTFRDFGNFFPETKHSTATGEDVLDFLARTKTANR